MRAYCKNTHNASQTSPSSFSSSCSHQPYSIFLIFRKIYRKARKSPENPCESVYKILNLMLIRSNCYWRYGNENYRWYVIVVDVICCQLFANQHKNSSTTTTTRTQMRHINLTGNAYTIIWNQLICLAYSTNICIHTLINTHAHTHTFILQIHFFNDIYYWPNYKHYIYVCIYIYLVVKINTQMKINLHTNKYYKHTHIHILTYWEV